MPAQVSCPFCSYEVAPARAPTGALLCPLCRNTGNTRPPTAETLQQELASFEARIDGHISRVQRMLDDMAHAPIASDLEERFTRLEDEVRNRGARSEAAATATAIRLMETPSAGDIDERVTQLEDRLEDVWTRMDATATATAIRLEAEAATKNMDDLVGAVEALRNDIRELHEEYDRAAIPALRHQVKMLAANVRSLEAENDDGEPAWDNSATAEWQRPEPDTVDEAETPRWSIDLEQQVTDEEADEEDRAFEEPLSATAASSDPLGTATTGPGSDFSDVPPVMDDGSSMRDLVARDAMAMAGASHPGEPADPDPLDAIESALHDIDERLQTLHRR